MRCIQLVELQKDIVRKQALRQHGGRGNVKDGSAEKVPEQTNKSTTKSKAASLWAKAGRRIAAARAFASHASHYSCHPCSIQCQSCKVPVLLAGFEFHSLACKKLNDERKAIADGNVAEAMRSMSPLSACLLDSYNQTAQGASEKARNQRRRQSWRGTKRAMVADDGPLPHSTHYSCNPCTIICAGCEKAVVLAGFAQHQKSCARRRSKTRKLRQMTGLWRWLSDTNSQLIHFLRLRVSC